MLGWSAKPPAHWATLLVGGAPPGRASVNAIETGKYGPSLELAFALAKQFGVRVDEVFFPE